MSIDSFEPDTLPELLTIRQVADYLSIPVSTIYLWRSKRQGPPGFRVGKRLVFRAADVARWLEEQAP